MAGTVLLLGAGASRGALFPNDVPHECLPPLNADFFTQLQRITEDKHSTSVRRVIKDLVQLHGSNFSLTLEDYFTELEFLSRVVRVASQRHAGIEAALSASRRNLMAALHAVLESSTDKILRSDGGCERHKTLVKALRKGDTVLSFNYDCLMDDALRRVGDAKWNARWGYGFPDGFTVSGWQLWNPARPTQSRRTVKLLKLHGSINWQLPSAASRRIVLKQRLHQQHGVPQFSIIPPVWNKAIESPVYAHLWRRARWAIRQAHTIVVIGFSFAPTDLYAQSLFRVAFFRQDRTRLRRLVIVSPDKSARQRVRQIFDVPLTEHRVLLRQYEKLEEFVDALPAALT